MACSPGIRLRLDIAYDGTNFSGWAMQAGRRTVAGDLTQALTVVLRTPVHLVVAGRTDAGVHATGQVAHLDLAEPVWRQHRDMLLRRLAGVLPADVAVRRLGEVPATFDARFAALRRHYRYRLADGAEAVNPLRRADTVTWPRPLEVEPMQQAGAQLEGTHDFAAYCKFREGATTVRQLQRLTVVRAEDGAVSIGASADAFCHSMVRSLVGALLVVGQGRKPPDWPASLLALRQRTSHVHVAPARGLTLTGVDYPKDTALAERVATTRARRDPVPPERRRRYPGGP